MIMFIHYVDSNLGMDVFIRQSRAVAAVYSNTSSGVCHGPRQIPRGNHRPLSYNPKTVKQLLYLYNTPPYNVTLWLKIKRSDRLCNHQPRTPLSFQTKVSGLNDLAGPSWHFIAIRLRAARYSAAQKILSGVEI